MNPSYHYSPNSARLRNHRSRRFTFRHPALLITLVLMTALVAINVGGARAIRKTARADNGAGAGKSSRAIRTAPVSAPRAVPLSPTLSCVTQPDGMVSWWRAENNAFDQQDGNNGTLVNGASFAAGEVGQGFSLNGTDQYVDVADSPILSITGPMTIDAWINANDNTSEHAIVEKYDGGGTDGYFFRLDATGHLVAGMANASTFSTVTGATQVTTGTFHHVAAVFDGTNLQVYLDGNLDGTAASVAPTDGVNPLEIGARGGSPGNFFNGLIDEVEIFNRALSSTEIQSIVNAGSAGKCITCAPPPSSMVSWWPADGNATDIRGGNNGTLVNGATFAAGEVGQAFSFDGVDDYVSVPDAVPLRANGAITIDFWAKFNTVPRTGNGAMFLLEKNNDYIVFWRADLQALEFSIADNCDDAYHLGGDVSLPTLQAGDFHHYALTAIDHGAGGTEFHFFFDGVEQTVTPNVDPNHATCGWFAGTSGELRIGIRTQGSPSPFNGLVDELEIFNRALPQSEIQKIFDAGTQGKCKSCTPPPSNMVSWWPGDGNPFDIKGANDGTFNGTSAYAAGEVSQAFSFNGDVANYVSVPANASLDLTQFTVDAWIFPTGNSGGTVIDKEAGNGINYALFAGSGGAEIDYNPGNHQFVDAPAGSVPDNTWTHITGTYDGPTSKTLKLYINGVLVGTHIADPNMETPPVGQQTYIGARFSNNPPGVQTPFTGLIDEVEVFNGALSESEIRAIYDAGSNGKCRTCTSPPSQMIDWWPAEGNTNDIKGGNNGTLQNGATFATGYVGQAFKLNGTNQYVNASSADLTSTFTIDAWVNPDSLADGPSVFSKDDGVGGSHYFQIEPAGTLVGSIRNTSGFFTQYRTNSSVVAAGVWQHIVLTYDGSAGADQKMNFYVNGVNAPATHLSAYDNGGTPLTGSGNAKIGIFGDGTTGPFGGRIDELEIFNRALSASDIEAIVNAGNAGKCRAETITKSFGDTNIPVNGTTSLSFTITNPNTTSTQTGIGFSDTLPSGLVVATPNGLTGSCGGGTITATQNTNSISLSGASLGPSGSCTFSVNVTGTSAGVKNNTTGNISSNEGGMGGTASASITVVAPPTIQKTFSLTQIAVGVTSTLTFSITNPNTNLTLNGIAFTDNLPAGLVVANPPNLTGVCGGTVTNGSNGTLSANDTSIKLAGGTLASSGSCTINVDVTGTTTGVKNNSVQVTSTEGGTGNTSNASITVVSCPTSFTVNDNGDAHDATPGDGVCATAGAVCTLRAAIEEANADSGCGTIDINFNIGSSTITLTNGQLTIIHSVNVNGPTANSVTISGNNASRIFNVNSGKSLLISFLTIANGKAAQGGGIFNAGTLTITNSTLTGNATPDGIDATGAANGGNSTDGGAIYSTGPLTIINSTISGNKTGRGGDASGTGNGGNSGEGAGIYYTGAAMVNTIKLTNSTVANNKNGRPGQPTGGNNTGSIGTSGLGGGIFQSGGTLTLNNTIVATNTDGFSDPDDINGTATSSNFNLIGSDAGLSGISNGSNGNQVGTAAVPLSPHLGALASNGGPTQTQLPDQFSTVIDAGSNALAVDQSSNPLTTDQRGTGFPRKIDGGKAKPDEPTVDIGAVEVTATAAPAGADLTVTKSVDRDTVVPDRDLTYTIVVTNNGGDAATSVSLTDNLPQVTNNSDPDNPTYTTTTFVSLSSPAGWSCSTPSVGSGGTVSCTKASFAGVSQQTFTLVVHVPPSAVANSGDPFITNTVSVDAANDTNTENNGGFAVTQLFSCFTNPIVTKNTDNGPGTLRQAIADACVGATITFDMTQFASPITLTTGELVINKNLTISGPGANLLTVQRSTAGGTPNFRVFNVQSGTVNISGLTISNGNLNGAVIPAADSDKTASITPNILVATPGGGILNAGTLVLKNITVNRNSADRAGGISNSGTLTLVNSTVSGNISTAFGGGVVSSGATTIINTTFSGNATAGQGGGVYSDTGGTLTLTNTTITNNRSDSDNSGAEQGGGIFRNAGTVTLKNTIVAGNFRGTGTTRDDVSGALDASSSFNLIGDGTNMTGISNGSSGNQVGSAGSPINAMLGALAFNGGATQTHLPLPSSPAVNTGSNANLPADTLDLDGDSDTAETLPVDQRGIGFSRVVNTTVDIGAVETNYAISATAGSAQNTNVNTAFATALQATVTESGTAQNNVQVTFTAPASGASGTFPGPSTTAVVSTNASGIATAPTFTANAIGGSYNVVASIGTGLPTANFALTNNKLNQTITFAAISNKTTLDADFVVSPTASSSLPVALSASGTCTVTTPSPGTVHITGAGNCTITASQAGDATYNAATSVQQSFTISKVNQTITFGSIPNKTFGDADFSVSPTASSSLAVTLAASGNCTVTTPAPGTVHITGAGNCTITASQAGNGTYNAATNVQQSFTIAKAATATAVSATPSPSNSGQNVTFTATVTSTAGTPTGTVQFKDGGANLGSAQTLNGSGVATFSTTSLTPGVHTITADYSGDVNFLTSSGTLSGGQQVGSIIRFSSPTYNTTEGSGFTTITIQRIGDLSQAVTVDYATPDDSSATTVLPCSTASGVASPRCDFEPALGTIRWAAGDGASKTFTVLINQDNFVEGPETLTLTLSNLTGAGAAFPTPGATTSTATLTIADDITEPATNPIDDTDTFVRQHYRDFLNREPDAPGLAFWKDNIDQCNDSARRPAGLTVAQCIEVQRINTSASFFLSIEFQNTGYFVERVYKAGFGDISPPTVPVPVRFTNFFADTQQIGNGVIVGVGSWQTQLENNKTAFALAFVQRTAFLNRYPAATSATAFVDTLDANAGNVLSFSERAALISELSPSPADPNLRADVLKKVAENATLQQREFNRAFVLLQYFGYLRRNPDAAPEPALNFAGYNFWLNKLNQFNGNYIDAEMVKAFLSSAEYRHRFGP